MPTPTLTLAMNDPDSELVEAIAPHPSLATARGFIKEMPSVVAEEWYQIFKSTPGHERMAETLVAVVADTPCSDREVIGVAWWIRMSMEYANGPR